MDIKVGRYSNPDELSYQAFVGGLDQLWGKRQCLPPAPPRSMSRSSPATTELLAVHAEAVTARARAADRGRRGAPRAVLTSWPVSRAMSRTE
jgi:hypothetical protein